MFRDRSVGSFMNKLVNRRFCSMGRWNNEKYSAEMTVYWTKIRSFYPFAAYQLGLKLLHLQTYTQEKTWNGRSVTF